MYKELGGIKVNKFYSKTVKDILYLNYETDEDHGIGLEHPMIKRALG